MEKALGQIQERDCLSYYHRAAGYRGPVYLSQRVIDFNGGGPWSRTRQNGVAIRSLAARVDRPSFSTCHTVNIGTHSVLITYSGMVSPFFTNSWYTGYRGRGQSPAPVIPGVRKRAVPHPSRLAAAKHNAYAFRKRAAFRCNRSWTSCILTNPFSYE